MANNERIDDIISEKAFKQLDDLLQKLGSAQDGFADLATGIIQANNQITKSNSLKEFNDSIRESNKAFEEMRRKETEVVKVRQEANKVEKETIQLAKGKLLGVQEEKKLLTQLAGTLEQNIKAQLRLKLEIKAVQDQQKELNGALKTSDTINESVLNQKIELAKRENELKEALRTTTLETKRAIKENNAAESSYNELNARLERLRAAYRDLSEEERNNIDVGGALIASIKEYDKELKDIDKSMGITNRNVGNYTQSIGDAIDQTGLFGSEIATLRQLQQSFAGAAKLATVSVQSFSKALIASGIGAIIIVLASLALFLTKNQEGMDKLSKAFAFATGFVDVFIGAMVKLGKQIFEQTIPTIKGLAQVLAGLGLVLAGQVSAGITRMTLGFEQAQNALSKIDPLELDELAKAAWEAGKQAIALKDAQIELERVAIRSITTLAKLNAQLTKYNQIADDNTLSFKERREAAEQALIVEQQLANENMKLANLEVQIVNQRVELARQNNMLTRDLEREQAEAIAKKIETEANYTKALFENSKRQRELKQDELERDLDILLDGFDNQKSINERLIADESATFDKRVKLLDETKKLGQDSFDSQIDTIQEFTNMQLDANDLLQESDARRLNEKIRSLGLSEIIEGRLLEIIRDRRTAVMDLNEVEKNLEKERLERSEAERVRANSKILAEIETQRDNELTVLQEKFNAGVLLEEEYNAERLGIQKKYTLDYLNEEVKATEQLIQLNKERGLDIFDQEKELAALKLRIAEEVANAQIDNNDKVGESEKQLADLRRELYGELANLGATVINRQFENELQQIRKRNEEIDISSEKQKLAVENSVQSEAKKAEQIKMIDLRAQQEKEALEVRTRAIQKRQAQFDKASAIASIVVNTAAAIMKQLAGAPLFPISGPLIPIIAGIGAVQLGSVLATPIPEYFRGTENSIAGLAWVGEQGEELIKTPSGDNYLTPNKPTLTYLEGGSIVKTAPETKRLMKESLTVPQNLVVNGVDNTKELKILTKAVLSKKQTNISITKSGFMYVHRNNNSWTKYIGKNL